MAAMARSGAWMYFVLFTLGALHCRLLCGYTTVAIITVLLVIIIIIFFIRN